MIYPLFSVRDLKAGFDFPHPDRSEATAIRGFSYQMNNNDLMNFSAKDYDLYKVGEFDVDKGTIVPLKVPVLVCSGSSVIGEKDV